MPMLTCTCADASVVTPRANKAPKRTANPNTL